MHRDEMIKKLNKMCIETACIDCKLGFSKDCCEFEEEIDENLQRIYDKTFKSFVEFKLSNIKPSMLLELRSDKLVIVHQSEGMFRLYGCDGTPYANQGDYLEDMTDESELKDFDIMKVYGYSNSNRLFDIRTRELLWERTDEKVKLEICHEIETQEGKIIIQPNGINYGIDEEIYICTHNKCHKFAQTSPIGMTVEDAKKLVSVLVDVIKISEEN